MLATIVYQRIPDPPLDYTVTSVTFTFTAHTTQEIHLQKALNTFARLRGMLLNKYV